MIQRHTAKRRRDAERKEERTREFEKMRERGDTPKMNIVKEFTLQCWGRVLSYEMVIRQSLNMLRTMARRGWSNDTKPVYKGDLI